MRKLIYPEGTSFLSGRFFERLVFFAAPVLISALLLLSLFKFSGPMVLFAAFTFFAFSVITLTGRVAKWLIYSVFLFQISVSYYLQLSFYATIICLAFFPLIFLLSNNADKIDTVPHRKSLTLMISGWIITLSYVFVFNYSNNKYMFMYDAYLLLGLGIAYLIFYLLKLKYLDIEKLMLSIALSGLVIIGMTLVKYFVKGFAQEIIYDRFGLLVNVNPNFLGLYLNMALPCAFFMALSEKCVNSKKVLLYAVSIVYICVMVMTGSRGCLPGAILVIGYFVWRKRSLKVFLSNLIASGTILIVFGSNLIERMVTPSVDGVAELGRIFLLKAAFKILEANHYVFGIGMNSFALAKFDYGCPRWLPAPVPTETMSSHNVFMEVWVGWGILGLFGWLIFNGAVLHAIFLNRKKSVYKNNVYAYAVAFAMISFLIYGLVDSNIGNFSMMFTYFTLVGIAFFIESENTAKLSVNGG